MRIVCLDLEGVLVPEIWIAFAEKTGVVELTRTTRDEPDYEVLMRYRLEILNKHGFFQVISGFFYISSFSYFSLSNLFFF